jgi:DNA-binding transcriptional LysR family regulator
MKVIALQNGGRANLRVAERPRPVPARQEILIKVAATSLNYRDLEIINGTYHTSFDFPLVPLSDGVGEVVEVGADVSRFTPGDRVCSTFWQRWVGGAFRMAEVGYQRGGPIDGLLAEFALLDEQAVRVALLDRRQKPPTLTPAGQDVLVRGREILAAVDEIMTLGAAPQPAGRFRLGVPNGFYHRSLAKVLAAVARCFPAVSMTLESGWSAELIEQHRLGKLDAAIILADASSAFDGKKTGEERLAIVGSSEHYGTDVDLAEQPWVLSSRPCAARAALAARLAREGRSLVVTAEVDDPKLQIGLIREGLGLGLLPRRLLLSECPKDVVALGNSEDDLYLDVLSLRSPHLGSLAKVADMVEAQLQALTRSD